MIYLIGTLANMIIAVYSYYFLVRVRYYPCIWNKMSNKINVWSWLIVLGGGVASILPAYSLRAYFVKDHTTEIVFIFQILVWIYGILLFYFHIKTTSNEKVV
jgi:hypothetical protein